METSREHDIYRALARAIFLATAVYLGIWLIGSIVTALLFLSVALILALSLNLPVTWLETKGMSRSVSLAVVLVSLAAITALLAWLVFPRLVADAREIAEDVPVYVSSLTRFATNLLSNYPDIQRKVEENAGRMVGEAIPILGAVLLRIGAFSLTMVGMTLFAIFLATTVIFMVALPRPLIGGFFMALPARFRDPAERAFVRSSEMVTRWLWSNLIVGGIEGAIAAAFLTYLGVPGAVLWGFFTFFAEQVPKLGAYIMSIPPILVALAIDPMKALWVTLCFFALNEFTGFVISPIVRSKKMKLHPVSLIFSVLAMALAFGVLGALIATPLAGIIKAVYEEFYLKRQPEDDRLDERVDNVLMAAFNGKDGLPEERAS